MNTTNRTILITGATRGIGFELLRAFYSRKNKIIAIAKNQDNLNKLSSMFKDVITYNCELSDQQSRTELINIIKNEHPDIDTIVNNAGVQNNFYDNRFGDLSTEWSLLSDEILINFYAPVEFTYKLIPLLMNHEEPSIINISSALAFVPKKSAPVYCGTKAAIHIFTKSLRYQYENTKLKIFEVIPPLVDTDMSKNRSTNKISAIEVAHQCLEGFRKNQYEINIGKTKLLRFLQRLSPATAEKIIKNN